MNDNRATTQRAQSNANGQGRAPYPAGPTQKIRSLQKRPPKDQPKKERFKIVEDVVRVTYHNKDTGYVVLKTRNTKNRNLPEKTLVGICTSENPQKELVGVSVTFNGFVSENAKFGVQYEFEQMFVNESSLFYFLTKVVKGFPGNLASELITKYGEEGLERIIDTDPRRLLNYKGIAEKRLEMILKSWQSHKELKAVSDLLTPAGASMDVIWAVHYEQRNNPRFLDEIRKNPWEALTSLKGVGFKRADRIARGMGVAVNSIFRVKACIEYALREIADRDGHSLLNKGDLFQLVAEELAVVNQDIREEAEEARAIAAVAQGELALNDTVASTGIENTVVVNDEVFITQELFDQAVDELLNENDRRGYAKLFTVGDDYSIASGYLKHCEESVVNSLRNRAAKTAIPLSNDIDKFIAGQEAKMGIEFSDEQKDAIRLANSGSRAMVICGYAGTGKSTIARAVLDLLKERYGEKNIICCALSGIAADRIRKTSGYNSRTIHSLLGARSEQDDDEQDRRSRGDELPQSVVLVDESSMINSVLMNNLMRKVKGDAHVILMGDPAQLPPIGAGNPFSDIVDHTMIPTVKLEKIYRQREGQVLTNFAGYIRRNAIPPGYEQGGFEDFFFVSRSIPDYYKVKARVDRGEISKEEFDEIKKQNYEQALKSVKRLAVKAKERLDEALTNGDLGRYISFFQVITPRKDGLFGTRNLNVELREILNPPPSSPAPQQAEEGSEKETEETGEEKKGKGKNGNEAEDGPFMRVMDKVVHTKNMDLRAYEPEVVRKYGFDRLTDSMGVERRIYNGMIGIVANVDPDTEAVYVNFPADEVYVKYEKLDARYFLQHAYALTIHKVQGSEFNVVVIPVLQAHYNMLNSKLLYTAVTRAKEKAIFVGETYAFNGACKRKSDVIRNTVMRKILSGETQQEEQDTFFGNMPAYGGGATHV